MRRLSVTLAQCFHIWLFFNLGSANAQLPDNLLVAEYLFSGNADDGSGNRHHGHAFGVVLAEDRFGRPESAYRFDGVDDYIDISSVVPALESSAPSVGSISLWFKASGNHEGRGSFLIRVGDADNIWNGPSIILGDGTNFSGQESITWTTHNACLNYFGVEQGHRFYFDDLWHHVVIVVGGDFNEMYVDGTLTSGRYFAGIGTSSTGNCMWPLGIDVAEIGRVRDNPNTDLFMHKGLVDDVRIYARPLTEDDVAALYEEVPLPDYVCSGFQSPLDNGAVTVKRSRALPLKAELFDSDGVPTTDLEVTALPVLEVTFSPAGSIDVIDVTDQALPAGKGTDGNQFEFSEGLWRFNLRTNNYTASGSYTVTMVSGDESEYLAEGCVAQFVVEL